METRDIAVSPDGRYAVRVASSEVRMSHWVDHPSLHDRLTGAILLRFHNPNWSLDRAEWLDPRRVALDLPRYPGDQLPTGLRIIVDCARGQARLGDALFARAELEAALDAALRAWRLHAAERSRDRHSRSRAQPERTLDSLRRSSTWSIRP